MKQNVAAKVYSLLEKAIVENGYSIWDITYGKEAGEMLLTVTVDIANNGESGSEKAEISLDMLSDLNEIINDILDREDPIAEAYSLMLESAGAERVLRTDEHIKYAVDKNAHVELKLYKGINTDSNVNESEGKEASEKKAKSKGKKEKSVKKDFVGKILEYNGGVLTFEAEITEEEKGKTVNKAKGEKAVSVRKEIYSFERKQISKLIAYV